jgi:hypothetical protein
MPTVVRDAHSMVALESTPNGMSGVGAFFFEQCKQAEENVEDEIEEAGVWRLVFIEWWKMRLSFRVEFESPERKVAFEKSLTAEEKDLMRQYPIDVEQLLWRRGSLHGPPFNNDIEHWMQEYPQDLETAFLSSGYSIISRKTLTRLRSQVEEPLWAGDIYWGEPDDFDRATIYDRVRRPKFLTRGEARHEGWEPNAIKGHMQNLVMYEWPKKGDRIYITADPCGGDPNSKDGDYACALIGRLGDGYSEKDAVIGKWHGRINPLKFGELCAALGWACYNLVGDDVKMPEVCPEWIGPGVAMLTYMDRHHLYPNIFLYIAPSSKGQHRTKHLGWESNSKTNRQSVHTMQKWLEQDLIDVPDKRVILELAAYRQFDEGGDEASYGGQAGTHDDCVSALRMLCARLMYETGLDQTEPIRTVADWNPDYNDLEDDSSDAWDPHEAPPPQWNKDDVDEGNEEMLFWSDVAEQSVKSAAWSK